MLIAKNHLSEYQIIYSSNPTLTQNTAVKELKKYITQISGAYIPYFWDSRPVQEKEIVVGYTNRGGYTEKEVEELGDEGFIIRSEGEKIFIIAAGKRGVLYGVYSFLEEYCGCRFYLNDFEKIPTTKTLEIAPISENKQIPVFNYRNPYWHAVSKPGISVKLKINGEHGRWNENAIPDYLGGSEKYHGGFCHTITELNESNDYWHQPCYCDEVVYQRVIKNVRKILKANPEAKIVSITQTDGNEGACKCEKCKAINDREESEAGTNIMFVNRIAEELEEEYPNVLFDTFAYRFTRKPPKTLKPRKNVMVRMCTIECCNRHPIAECPENPGYTQDDTMDAYIRKWANITDKLAVWNYVTNFTNFPVMFPNWDAMLKDERYFADHRFYNIFEQGNIAAENGEFSELRSYILARTLWDPYMSEEKYWAYIKEFINDFYGEAGEYIYDFIKLTLDYSENSHMNVYFDNPCNNVYAPGVEDHQEACHIFADKATVLFDKAEEATKDNAFAFANVRRSRIQLYDYIDFMLRADRAPLEEDAEKNADAIKKLTDEIIANNTFRFNYMKMYDVSSNHEFRDMDELSTVDLSDYGLRW